MLSTQTKSLAIASMETMKANVLREGNADMALELDKAIEELTNLSND